MNNLKKILLSIFFTFGLIEKIYCINPNVNNQNEEYYRDLERKKRNLILEKYSYILNNVYKYYNLKSFNKNVIEICEKILKIENMFSMKRYRECRECRSIHPYEGFCFKCIRENKLFDSCENIRHSIEFNDFVYRYMINARIIIRDGYGRGIILLFRDIKEVEDKLLNFENEVREYKEQIELQRKEEYYNYFTDEIQ